MGGVIIMKIRNITTITFLLISVIVFSSTETVADSRFFMVDGDDAENSVTATFINATPYSFGFLDETLTFEEIAGGGEFGSYDFIGGEAPNFALYLGDSYLTLLTDDATVTYLGPIDWENSENPSLSTDYWRGAWIAWATPFPDITIGITTSHPNDGFSPVPIPTTLLLLSTGLVALVGLRRKYIIQD